MTDEYRPRMSLGRSQGSVTTGTTTYNQTGITYNQVGLTYGGFYGFSDVQPTISRSDLIKPSLSVGKSQGQISNPGITYNETGVTYNQIGLTYGGLYGYSQVDPTISIAEVLTARMYVGRSQAQVNNPQITYNETGVTYNQVGLTYGGLYGFSQAEIVPHLSGGIDIYVHPAAPGSNAGIPIAPGFFLYITYV